MSFGNDFETAQLNLILNGVVDTIMVGIAQNHSSPETSLWIHLHTADPGEGGSGATNEATFGGYSPIEVPRDPGDPFWDCADGEATPSEELSILVTSGVEEITHGSLCKADDSLVAHGIFTPSRTTAPGKTITIPTTMTFVLD